MAITPIENLRAFVTGRPPVVLFMLCISLFAVVLSTVAYFIKVNEVKDPNLAEDWNVFLQSFSELEFCVTGNASEYIAPVLSHSVHGDAHAEMDMLSESTYEQTRNYSVSLLLSIQPTLDFVRIKHNVTHVHGMISGHQLGLKGPSAEEEVNITFSLPYNWKMTQCDDDGKCDAVQILTCVHFQAVPSVFPISRRPQMCLGLNETGVDYHARVEAHKDYSFLKYYRCRKQTKISVHYNLNPTLTVMLSLHDRSVINLHLMHTSYFLFVMVATIFCYAMIRGRSQKVKYVHVETEVKLKYQCVRYVRCKRHPDVKIDGE